MGFGHRVYKNYDPRARIIKRIAEQVFEVTGRNPKLDIALELERIALEDDYFVKRKLYPNVDFYSGIIYQAMGFKPEMFTVLFAIPRTVGWLAQWQEMVRDPEQKIARPRQIYTGQDDAGVRADREARRDDDPRHSVAELRPPGRKHLPGAVSSSRHGLQSGLGATTPRCATVGLSRASLWEKEVAELIEKGIVETIRQKRVTYDLHCQMEGAVELKRSEFTAAIGGNMKPLTVAA